jgi:hypothetical protein
MTASAQHALFTDEPKSADMKVQGKAPSGAAEGEDRCGAILRGDRSSFGTR